MTLQVSADVFRVLSAPDFEPVVLFRHGAARFMNSLLAAPQQPIEEILSEGELIRLDHRLVAVAIV